ncbi:MAG: YraN family protein [Aquificaceae bacterium]|nr:YraN family protein [Aquificaceae bacterium]
MQLGKNFEEIALNYLKSIGCKLISKNFRCKDGEIDLIVICDSTLVFVEVKGSNYLNPIERITPRKLKNIISCIEYYLSQKPHDGDIRLDVICINKDHIEHLRGVEIDTF